MLKTKGLILSLMVLASLSLTQVMAQNNAPNSYFVWMETATRYSFLAPNDGSRVAVTFTRLWGPTTKESCDEYLRTHCQFRAMHPSNPNEVRGWYC